MFPNVLERTNKLVYSIKGIRELGRDLLGRVHAIQNTHYKAEVFIRAFRFIYNGNIAF